MIVLTIFDIQQSSVYDVFSEKYVGEGTKYKIRNMIGGLGLWVYFDQSFYIKVN